MAESYTCAVCRGVFDKLWPDEDAMQEAEIEFGRDAGKLAIVCDDCYRRIIRWKRAQEGAPRRPQ